MSDHLTTALVILLASLPVTLPAAVLVLRWGFRDDGRPPGYKPRHRRPWWPRRRRKAAEFVGVTLDSPPLAEHTGADDAWADELAALTEVAIVEPTESERLNAAMWGELAAHWHRLDREFADDVIRMRMAFGPVEARASGLHGRRWTLDEPTGPIDVSELRRELAGAR